jgi:hypothetical protein
MAVLPGQNSYCPLEEADSYFEDRLDAAAWLEASETEKSQSLVTATSMLDDMEWLGVMASSSQVLAFPRTGMYYDPRAGWNETLDPVPSRLIRAQKELAYHLLNNDGLLDDTGMVESLKIGSAINLEKITTANGLPRVVKNLIRPMLLNQGSKNWWRAN